MRTETQKMPTGNNLSEQCSKVQTNFFNKTISLEIVNRDDHNILYGSYQNGGTVPSEIILEKAAIDFHFFVIGKIEDYPSSIFHFTDNDIENKNKSKYRLRVSLPNGTTYYSEILCCSN